MKYMTFALVFGSLCLYSCGGGGGDNGNNGGGVPDTTYSAPWPDDVETVYTADVIDPIGDAEIAPGGGPPYAESVQYAPSDLTRVAFGIDDGFLYMRMEFAAITPTEPDYIAANGEIEEQWVTSQSQSINWNNDGDYSTGAGGEGVDGIDSFAAYSLDYGRGYDVYINYGFPDGDIHHHQGQVEGEVGSGGPGTNFIVARFPLADMAEYFNPGDTLEWSGWSEAESSDAASDGSMLYHHFSFDPWPESQMWTMPAE